MCTSRHPYQLSDYVGQSYRGLFPRWFVYLNIHQKNYFNHDLPSRFFFKRDIFLVVNLLEQFPWLIKLDLKHWRTKSAYEENTENKQRFHCCCYWTRWFAFIYILHPFLSYIIWQIRIKLSCHSTTSLFNYLRCVMKF